MNTIAPIKPKIVRKPSLPATLKSFEIGIAYRLTNRDFKLQAARQAISELRKRKYEFTISEAGLVDEYIITCTKKPIK